MKWEEEGVWRNTHTARLLSDSPNRKRREYRTGNTTVFNALSREQLLLWFGPAGETGKLVVLSMEAGSLFRKHDTQCLLDQISNITGSENVASQCSSSINIQPYFTCN